MRSHKALDQKVFSFETLVPWHDIEMERRESGEFVTKPNGFDPLRDYVSELDEILITGKVRDFDKLRELRKDLEELRDRFLKLKLEGLYEPDEEGGQDNE